MDMDFYRQTIDKLAAIAEIHGQSEKSLYPETLDQEQEVMDMVNTLINDGAVELYPLKALLAASNNWNTYLFVRESIFREILDEGVRKGCLEPQNELAWAWLEVAAVNNDPVLFMDDVEEFYDILATAAESGNLIARDIMNDIWEPENIIEED